MALGHSQRLTTPLWARRELLRPRPISSGGLRARWFSPFMGKCGLVRIPRKLRLRSYRNPRPGDGYTPHTPDVGRCRREAIDISFLNRLRAHACECGHVGCRVAVRAGEASAVFSLLREIVVSAHHFPRWKPTLYPDIVKQAEFSGADDTPMPFSHSATIHWKVRTGKCRTQTRCANVLNAWIHGDLVNVHMLGVAHTMGRDVPA